MLCLNKKLKPSNESSIKPQKNQHSPSKKKTHEGKC